MAAIWIQVTAGIAGTFIMTLFMKMLSGISSTELRVPGILGSLAVFEKTSSGKPSRSVKRLFAGNVLHYAIGVLWLLVYTKASARYGGALLRHIFATSSRETMRGQNLITSCLSVFVRKTNRS